MAETSRPDVSVVTANCFFPGLFVVFCVVLVMVCVVSVVVCVISVMACVIKTTVMRMEVVVVEKKRRKRKDNVKNI